MKLLGKNWRGSFIRKETTTSFTTFGAKRPIVFGTIMVKDEFRWLIDVTARAVEEAEMTRLRQIFDYGCGMSFGILRS